MTLSQVTLEACVIPATLGQYTLGRWWHQSSTFREGPRSTRETHKPPTTIPGGHQLRVGEPGVIISVEQ